MFSWAASVSRLSYFVCNGAIFVSQLSFLLSPGWATYLHLQTSTSVSRVSYLQLQLSFFFSSWAIPPVYCLSYMSPTDISSFVALWANSVSWLSCPMSSFSYISSSIHFGYYFRFLWAISVSIVQSPLLNISCLCLQLCCLCFQKRNICLQLNCLRLRRVTNSVVPPPFLFGCVRLWFSYSSVSIKLKVLVRLIEQALTRHLSLVNLFRQRVAHRETLCIIRNSVFVVPAMLPKMISASTLKNCSPPKDLLRIRLKDSQVHEFFF